MLRPLHPSSSAQAAQQQPTPSIRAAVRAAAMSDLRSMARLSSFSTLMAHCKADTWIVLDLDDTVYCGYHSPCHMMTERGLQRYQSLITGHAHYKQLPFASKSSITRQLQAAVSRKRGVERDTIRTIKQLQAAGVPVFALTARFSSMIATTKLELASLSLDMSLTSPFRTFVRDTETSAVISDGIIFSDGHSHTTLATYERQPPCHAQRLTSLLLCVRRSIACAGQEKGPILNRFPVQRAVSRTPETIPSACPAAVVATAPFLEADHYHAVRQYVCPHLAAVDLPPVASAHCLQDFQAATGEEDARQAGRERRDCDWSSCRFCCCQHCYRCQDPWELQQRKAECR